MYAEIYFWCHNNYRVVYPLGCNVLKMIIWVVLLASVLLLYLLIALMGTHNLSK